MEPWIPRPTHYGAISRFVSSHLRSAARLGAIQGPPRLTGLPMQTKTCRARYFFQSGKQDEGTLGRAFLLSLPPEFTPPMPMPPYDGQAKGVSCLF